MQHCLDLVSCEVRKRDFLGQAFPIQLHQEMAQAREHLVTAIGQQEKERINRAASCQVMEEFQADVVTPMQVFQNQEDRSLNRLRRKEVCQNLKAAALLLLRIERC